LGGSALYHGKVINLPILGKGEPITIKDIPRSIVVVQRAVLLLILFVLFISTYQLVSCFLYR